LLLGSKPSLIIKFKNQVSNLVTRSALSKDSLLNLSNNSGVRFTESRVMSQGAYQVNVFSKFTSPVDCQGPAPCLLVNTVDEINALSWLADTDFTGISAAPYVVAINMSLGGTGTCPLLEQDAFDTLLAKNISVAVAAAPYAGINLGANIVRI
jgi:hypothetical protein